MTTIITWAFPFIRTMWAFVTVPIKSVGSNLCRKLTEKQVCCKIQRKINKKKEKGHPTKSGTLPHRTSGNISAAYLCFCGPLVPLLLLIAAVCAVWNELSVYELEKTRAIRRQLSAKGTHTKQPRGFTGKRSFISPLWFPLLWVLRTPQLFQFLWRGKQLRECSPDSFITHLHQHFKNSAFN